MSVVWHFIPPHDIRTKWRRRRFAPNFRTNHGDVHRPRPDLSVVVQRAVDNLAGRLCSSKISGLGVEAPLHCPIIGRSALRGSWAAPPIKALSHKFGIRDLGAKIVLRKTSQEKTRDSSYTQCRRTPYLPLGAHRTSLTFIARVNSVVVSLRLKCLAIPNLCKTKLRSLFDK